METNSQITEPAPTTHKRKKLVLSSETLLNLSKPPTDEPQAVPITWTTWNCPTAGGATCWISICFDCW